MWVRCFPWAGHQEMLLLGWPPMHLVRVIPRALCRQRAAKTGQPPGQVAPPGLVSVATERPVLGGRLRPVPGQRCRPGRHRNVWSAVPSPGRILRLSGHRRSLRRVPPLPVPARVRRRWSSQSRSPRLQSGGRTPLPASPGWPAVQCERRSRRARAVARAETVEAGVTGAGRRYQGAQGLAGDSA